MKESIFLDCLNTKKKSGGVRPFWGTLFKKYASEGYKDKEHLRCDFKNERKRRGMLGKFEPEKINDGPRVGVCDVETLPGIGYFWGLWDQNIGLEQIVADPCLLGWAGKYLNESKMFSDILTPKEAIGRDAKRIAKSIWDFLSSCDVVIGHNFDGFDNKMINSAFLLYDLPPLKFTVVDTLKIARQNFKFLSNKLKFINQKLGIKQKVENDGFSLWRKCSEGDTDALKTMLNYNIGDIFSTEELFYKIRPYVRNFNVALYNEIIEPQCPVCGSKSLKTEGWYYTPAGKWESVRCNNCKCISRKKKNELDKHKKKSLLINSK